MSSEFIIKASTCLISYCLASQQWLNRFLCFHDETSHQSSNFRILLSERPPCDWFRLDSMYPLMLIGTLWRRNWSTRISAHNLSPNFVPTLTAVNGLLFGAYVCSSFCLWQCWHLCTDQDKEEMESASKHFPPWFWQHYLLKENPLQGWRTSERLLLWFLQLALVRHMFLLVKHSWSQHLHQQVHKLMLCSCDSWLLSFQLDGM